MTTNYYRVCPLCLAMAKHFHRDEAHDAVVAYTNAEPVGLAVHVNETGLAFKTVLVDEYGRLTTMGQLLERHEGKADHNEAAPGSLWQQALEHAEEEE